MTETKPTKMTRVVVGIDGSEQSELALRWAVRLAEGLGATVDAVIAWHYPSSYAWGAVPNDWNPEQDAREVLAKTLDSVLGSSGSVVVRRFVQEGPPARVLMEASEGAQMLIVGSRGHGGVAGLLLGSVSSACAEHAHCPVLVVHESAGQIAEATAS